MDFVKLHFEDKGQDFLIWEVDTENGKVVHCEPFQSPIWVNTIVTNLDDIISGKSVEVRCEWPESGSGKLNHKVKKVTADQELAKDLRFLREIEARIIFENDPLTLVRDWQNELKRKLKLPNFRFTVLDSVGVPVFESETLEEVYNFLTKNINGELMLNICDLEKGIKVSELEFIEAFEDSNNLLNDLSEI